MIRIADIFKVGIGPSSSHTVGPMVAANQFLSLLDSQLTQVRTLTVELYGSLAATGKGHATDTAVLLGLLGWTPKDMDTTKTHTYLIPIYQDKTLTLAGRHRIDFDIDKNLVWHMDTALAFHPNALSFIAKFDNGDTISETYYSIGGGFVVSDTHKNTPMPLTKADDVPYPFANAETLLQHCHTHNLSISDIMLANECHLDTQANVFAYLDNIWHVMQDCVRQGCKQDGILPGGLHIKRRAKALYDTLCDEYQQAGQKDGSLLAMDWVNVYALAVNEENASGGKIVTAPTNGAAGIIPAVMHYYRDFIHHYDAIGARKFLLTAGAIGILIKQNASISGAEVGCQGEVGSACAMAAAGLAEVLGANAEQCLNAAEIGLEHNLGLTCDPIAGLVQVPCIERNAMAAIKAINAARLALRGNGKHYVSLDKAILTMKQTGADMMDKYKETARGGLAVYATNTNPQEETAQRILTVNLGATVNFSQC